MRLMVSHGWGIGASTADTPDETRFQKVRWVVCGCGVRSARHQRWNRSTTLCPFHAAFCSDATKKNHVRSWRQQQGHRPRGSTGWFGACASLRLFGLTQTPQENHPLSPLHEPLHWRAKRDPKAKMLSLQSFLRKGVSLAYVGRN